MQKKNIDNMNIRLFSYNCQSNNFPSFISIHTIVSIHAILRYVKQKEKNSNINGL